ncbi:cyclin-L1 [Drosophila pseudoobscura]|uniref:Cyclin-L1 n=1 Tax=Drosophila pseudoobscura pseudoobscura TaxID=46245 RepID=Q29I19_DROPS|nr:cyclin-L1 [Drosophila pseudoobscura]XP_015041436.1 cyclin-L1 [Drosophila pseudoobscura]
MASRGGGSAIIHGNVTATAVTVESISNVLTTVTSLHSNSVNISNNISAGTGVDIQDGGAGAEGDTSKPMYPRLFNKIVLTLENSLIPESKIDVTPSSQDGLDHETEKDLRILGCELIQTAGILLRLPQVAMATGQVLFQRFFYSKSFVRHNMETVAMSCVCLASKIEEAPRRIRDVINVIHHIKQVRAQKEIAPMVLDQYYTNLKMQVIKAERRVLKELGFCVHVKHPHKLVVMYLQVLQYEKHEKLMQLSWNFMNDSLRTDVFMRYTPEAIACACIYLSTRKLNIPLPSNPPWFGIFRVPMADITDICYRVMELYTRPKPVVEKLEAAVDELKKRYLDARTKTKEANTPPAVITVDRNNGSHNAWGGFIQRAVPLPLPSEKSPEKDSRSRSRSRTRTQSRTPRSRSRSRSPSRERTKKSHRGRSPRTRSGTPPKHKKKSRHYSRSPTRSSSPHSKHRKRKSSRERSDYYTKKDRSNHAGSNNIGDDKYRNSNSSSGKHSRYSSSHRSSVGGGGGNGGDPRHGSRAGHKHRDERSRDRKR